MNKVLVAIPTAPYLNYGTYEKAFQTSEWGLANQRFDRVWGRFNGPCTERQAAVRDTWAKHITAPHEFKFFVGRTHEGPVPDDMVKLDVGDGYLELPWKIQGAAQYALDNGFDVMLKADDDTFITPYMIPFLEQTTVDYGGYVWKDISVGGGAGYVWSRRAMQAAVKATREQFAAGNDYEDWAFALVMRDAGIPATNLIGFQEEINIFNNLKEPLSFHPVSPLGMRQAYQQFYLNA